MTEIFKPAVETASADGWLLTAVGITSMQQAIEWEMRFTRLEAPLLCLRPESTKVMLDTPGAV